MLKPFMRLAIMFGAAVVLAAPSNVVYMQEEEPVIEEVYEYVEEPTIVEIEEVVETYIPEEETDSNIYFTPMIIGVCILFILTVITLLIKRK